MSFPLRPGDPRRIGRYEITGRLGQGGQGVVYAGRGPDGVQVAVKVLRAQVSEEGRARRRFVRELELARKVAEFCTARVLEADVEGDRPYIVSEFVDGPSLDELVRAEGPRTGAALHRLAIGTVTALAAIHRAGIAHRDLKPPNVLVAADGPRVIDFGIAKAFDSAGTMTSQIMGTPAYMAPEQITGREPGTAADLFAWAATILYAATGKAPFGDDLVPAVMHRILHTEPDLDPLPEPLRGLAAACLAKDPAHRPTAQQALLALIGSGPEAVPSPDTFHSPLLHPGTGAGGQAVEAAPPDDVGILDGRTVEDTPPDGGEHSDRRRIRPVGRRAVLLAIAGAATATAVAAVSVPLLRSGADRPARFLSGLASDMTCIAFGARGTLLAAGGEGGTVQLWDPRDGGSVGVLAAGSGVNALAFSPDGTLLAGAHRDGRVRLWDAATRRLVATLTPLDPVAALVPGRKPRDPGEAESVAFSPDGSMLVAGSEESGLIWFWNPATRELLDTTLSVVPPTANLVFSRDGRVLAVGREGRVDLWEDLSFKDPVASVPDPEDQNRVTTVVLHPSGKSLGFPVSEKTLGSPGSFGIVFIDPTTQNAIVTYKSEVGPVGTAAFSPDGRVLAFGGVGGAADGVVQLQDATTGRLITTLDGTEHPSRETPKIDHLAFSPDGRHLAAIEEYAGAGDDMRRIPIWEI